MLIFAICLLCTSFFECSVLTPSYLIFSFVSQFQIESIIPKKSKTDFISLPLIFCQFKSKNEEYAIDDQKEKITIDFSIDYLCVSSFKGETSAQSLPEIVTNLSSSLEGKDVLLVEDIVDSGRTIKLVMEALSKQNCNSCKLITLLDKPGGRVVELLPDYSCFKIDNLFVVGFGLDYKEKMRNLPYVGILKKECYTK